MKKSETTSKFHSRDEAPEEGSSERRNDRFCSSYEASVWFGDTAAARQEAKKSIAGD